MYNLYLDDWRTPGVTASYHRDEKVRKAMIESEWVIVKSYKEFVDYIMSHGIPYMVSFDHDLGDEFHFLESDKPILSLEEVVFEYDKYEELTGYHAAKWLVDYCLDNNLTLPIYFVHSDNPVGTKNIISYLENFKKH
jgi:hypothetical protein